MCTVRIEAEVDDVVYSGVGERIFTPDISERVACEEAENKAKVNILQQSSPQYLNSIVVEHCDTGTKDGKNRIINTGFGLPWLFEE